MKKLCENLSEKLVGKVYIVHCTAYIVHCAVYSVQFRVYSVKCTVMLYSSVFGGSPSVPQFREWNFWPGSCFASPIKRITEQLSGTSKWSEIRLSGTPKRSEIWLSGTLKLSEISFLKKYKWDFLGFFVIQKYFSINPNANWTLVKILKIVPNPL